MSRTPFIHRALASRKRPFCEFGEASTPHVLGWPLALASIVCGFAAFGCGNDAPTPPSQTNSGGSQTSGATSTGSGSTTGPSTGSSGLGTSTNGAATTGGSVGTTTGASGSSGETTTGSVQTTTGGSASVTTGGGTTTGGADSGTTGSGTTGTSASSDGGTKSSDGDGGRGTTGGSTSSTGSTTGGTTGSVGTNIVTGTNGNLDGYLFLFPCGSSHTGYDCANMGCDANNHATKTFTFNVGGQTGTIYNMTFRVRGVLEGYQYTSTTADNNGAPGATKTDYFARGGQVKADNASGADYNTYEVHVAPAVTGEANVYYLNAINVDPHSNALAQHLTFGIDEQNKTIKIPGGGTITFRVYDSNCRSVMNCGPAAGNTCAAPRTVSLSGGSPAAPASFAQPYQDPAAAYGQWFYFDITDISPAP